MKGSFVCISRFTGVSIHPNAIMFDDEKLLPQVEHIADSFDPILRSDRVLFIADNSTVWPMKDRFGFDRLPKLLLHGK